MRQLLHPIDRARPVVCLWLLLGCACAAPAEDNAGLEKPGLLAVTKSLAEADAVWTRIDAKPAFFLEDESIHPRLPPGPFEVVWQGYLRVEEPGPFRFRAFVCGSVQVEVGGARALEGRGDSAASRVDATSPVELEPGTIPFKIHYRSSEKPPARLQVWWEGPEFSMEPLPPWRLSHRPAEISPAAAADEVAVQGRAAAGRLGCARCHRSAFPGLLEQPPPGPSLADLRGRVTREWLLEWLRDPSHARAGARMPVLFAQDRAGLVERWLIADRLLLQLPGGESESGLAATGDHRMGRRVFLSIGCAACHFPPDADRAAEPDLGRISLSGIADRFSAEALAAFIANPLLRYPDGRMPRIPLQEEPARDVAAYLLLWSKRAASHSPDGGAPTASEIEDAAKRLGARGPEETGAALLRAKRCAACHSGLPGVEADGVPIDVTTGAVVFLPEKGCWSGRGLPRFTLDASEMVALAEYSKVARLETHPSPFEARRRQLERAGCARCHQRDTDRAPPIEEVGAVSGGAWLQVLPFQRTPRLTYASEKLTADHLLSAVRDGVTGLRPSGYTYRMPAFGDAASGLVRALAEADGALLPARGDALTTDDAPTPNVPLLDDATLGSLAGPELVGFGGYACVSCHLWNGQMFSSPDPGAIGPDLMRTVGRVRRDWFDRFLEAPARADPSTPMPAYFPKGSAQGLKHILEGDIARQKDALWSYFWLGKVAQSPRPAAPIEIPPPGEGEPPIVAQVPVRLPESAAGADSAAGTTVDGICVLYPGRDIVVYDIAACTLRGVWAGAVLHRGVSGRIRTYKVENVEGTLFATPPDEGTVAGVFRGYDRLKDGVRIRLESGSGARRAEVTDTIRLVEKGGARRLERIVEGGGQRAASSLELPKLPAKVETETRTPWVDTAKAEGPLERIGYRAVAYPRPKTASGDDLVMPSALAVDPKTGRVYIASMMRGEVFVLDDRARDGRSARFIDYARGLFQEAYSMLAEDGALYILHRRSLTRATDTDADGFADRFDRVASFEQGIADDYDYGYGLVREKTGAFVMTHAPHANQKLLGSGAALRLSPNGPPEPIAFGFRNPLGWCAGPEGEIFFTDNQGEWVATNKLCHLVEGRYYGYPNSAQRDHVSKRTGKAAVWVPYAWAKSVNGVAYDGSSGKFGPFAGQFFLAELMFGGAIVRASLERVNGEYQGACFPFWGKGLLGPLVLAFDPSGSLFVGSITEPGWMSQPDRGALFRIDWTGETPFEMRTIRILPGGFCIDLTRRAALESAREAASYKVEHYRYEHTGAYGSPELDRTDVTIERVEVSEDWTSVSLTLGPPLTGRVYRIGAPGVRSIQGEPLVHPVGAYTVNEAP